MDEPDLVYRPALWKALLQVGLAGGALWVLWEKIFSTADSPADWLLGALGLLLGATMVWEGLARLASSRRLAFSREGVSLTRWGRTRSLPWSKVRAVSVFGVRGVQLLHVDAEPPAKGFMTYGWDENPFEIVAQVESRQRRWNGAVESPKQEIEDRHAIRRRNAARRLGMAIALASAVLTFLSFRGVRLMRPDELPRGVESQWAVAPTQVQIATMVAALVLALVGLWRWLWPTGDHARPPILSTAQEHLVLGLTFLVQGMSVFMVWLWLQRPS